jgi:hypothetical protein
VRWDETDTAELGSALIESARYHGVLPLLDAGLSSGEAGAGWPKAVRVACAKSTVVSAAFERASRAEIVRVLDAFAAAGIRPLLLKGAALAYSHYPSPTLRPRADTDLLIPIDRQAEAAGVLAPLGYEKAIGVEGKLISYQAAWSRQDHSVTHHLDVHWRINNSQILARALGYDELAARAAPVPQLGPHAYAPSPLDALLLACIHRAGHASAPYAVGPLCHAEPDRLVWLYDIHLLVTSLSTCELDEFGRRAKAKKIAAICADGLKASREALGSAIPQSVTAALAQIEVVEPSARYLAGGSARRMVGDFRALDTWSDRARWIKELGFPPAGYMRSKYPDAVIDWLPVLYARRALSGIAGVVSSVGAAGPGA